MGSDNLVMSSSSPISSEHVADSAVSGLGKKHQFELKNLTLGTQPFKTLKFFILATIQYIRKSISYLLTDGIWLLLSSTLVVGIGVFLTTIDGPHAKHVEEFSHYFRFGLWWIALGVASSIGLGSGLHTFVLYLGPHIALFTIKAMQCGRVDLKSAPYDTIQLKSGPSWLDKDCADFGPPVFSLGSSVPLSSILPQVQLEAILWGIGTALGELPPYFISRAASISGTKVEGMEELDASTKDEGFIAKHLGPIKRWFFSHAEHLNFLSILALASVPNPLFDLAGIMCGQFGIPFWKFFLATLTGKAIIKTHIQTAFLISVCNNQLLEWIENELIWVLGFVPRLSSILPDLIIKLHKLKENYLAPVPSNDKGKRWLSVATIWNTIVWLMLLNFFATIITDTAQRYLKKQQDKEMAALTNKLKAC